MAECLNKNGPHILKGEAERACAHVADILDQKSVCQIDSEARDEDAAAVEDISEYESVLISSATDLVGAMANVYAQDFIEPLKQLLPKVTKYYAPSRSSSDRATAIGSLGEIITGMKAAITPFTGEILTVLSRGLQDEDMGIRSNAAFASGVLIEHSQSDLTQHYQALLGAIHPLLEKADSEDAQRASDNACGCLSRMIIKSQASVPLEQVVPVLLSALPLKRDMAEWSPVLLAFIGLVQSNNAVALQHIDQILTIIRASLQNDGGEDALGSVLRGQVVSFVSAINSSAPEKVAAAGLQAFLV